MARVLTILVMLAASHAASAHPTGSMVVVEGTVLWSYVCPVGNPDHHACVMRWDEEAGVRSWVTSSFPASDWMMAPAPEGKVYLIERYFDSGRQTHKARLLIASVGDVPQELIPWFEDAHRFGEGGFAALGDGRFLFVRYPHLYVLSGDGSMAIWKEWPAPVVGLRQTRDGSFLIRGASEAWLTTPDGTVVERWSGLLQELTTKPPFMGNRVFDADYADGALWIAYWGKRRFDVITGGTRTVVKAFEAPWLPHAVAVDGGSAFMLASTIAPGSDQRIRPNLWRMKGGVLDLLWGKRRAAK